MPTNTNAYNSRVTDEALEKRFRDTFRAQGGAELVDDLYAQGVIVPIVDFTAAATGQQLAANLQTAWDSTTGSDQARNTSVTLISNSGFWQVDLVCNTKLTSENPIIARMWIDDGVTETNIWGSVYPDGANEDIGMSVTENSFVVFLRSGDSLQMSTDSSDCILDSWYRQIATLSGDLVNPSGFSSS